MNIPALRLCADRVRCQPVVSMVTEWDVKVLSYSVSAQCKLQNKYYQLNLATVILHAALWLDPPRPDFDLTLQNPGLIHQYSECTDEW